MTVLSFHNERPPQRGRKATFDYVKIRATFAGLTLRTKKARLVEAARIEECSVPTVVRAIKVRDGKKTSKTTHGPRKLDDMRGARVLSVNHPAPTEKRTLFPTMVFDPKETVLKSGEYSAKIGSRVEKGPWKGFPIYTLALEERATCPTSCQHWSSCYCNNMPFARRFKHGPALEWRLEREVAALELKHPRGFLVRLHTAGDFYSRRYVYLWRVLMNRHEALHIFGYTARIDPYEDPIAYSLVTTVRQYWPRFAIRFSNGDAPKLTTVTIEHPLQKPEGAVICPAQWTPSGQTANSCGDCALCWSIKKPIAFLQH